VNLAALDSATLSGASSASIAADLASLLDDIAATAGVKIASMQLRADSAPPRSLASVGVRLTGTTDVSGLAELLRLTEVADTMLVVRELSVSQPDPVAPRTRPEALHVELLVETLARITPGRPR
jgi:hypothetical protein